MWVCRLCVLCVFYLSILDATSAAPQETVSVTGAPFQSELKSIDASGRISFHVVNEKSQSGDARTMGLDELVRWGNPVAARPQTIVVLVHGGQIVTAADWAGGAVVKLADRDIVLVSDVWNEVRLPRGLVSGVVFAQASRVEEREKLVEKVRDESSLATASPERPGPSLKGRGSPELDVVLLSNGDRVEGRVTKLESGSVAIETGGKAVSLALSRVEAIVFGERQKSVANAAIENGKNEPSLTTASRERPGPSLKGRGHFAVGLRDGSMVFAKSVQVGEKDVAVQSAAGINFKGGETRDVVFVQSLGGRIIYLSDLDGADYRHVPYLRIGWPYTRDRNVAGEPIVVRGKRYLKGIGMHSASRLTYRFDREFARFDASVAIDDSAKGRGSVTFSVYLLRDGKWAEAYKSGIVRGNEAPQPISVELQGAKGLTLTVDYADRGDELDHAVWLDARLVK